MTPAQTIRNELRERFARAETGEQFAEICRLEAEMEEDGSIEGSRQWNEENGQFGVGA